jgi:hypothetical protein
MVRILTVGAVAFGSLAAPAFAADLSDLPNCLKPRTLSSVTDTVTKETLIAQSGGFGYSDPACTYRVARPMPQPVPQEVPVRGLW